MLNDARKPEEKTVVPSEIEATVLRLREPASRLRTDAITSRATAFFGLLFAFQSIPAVNESLVYLDPFWAWVVIDMLFLLLLLCLVSAIFRWHVRVTMGIFALGYLSSLCVWPMTVLDLNAAHGKHAWLWYLLVAAVACATVAFSEKMALSYLVVSTVLYAVIRVFPAGGEVGLGRAILDGFYAFIVGLIAVFIITTLRRVSDRVDSAQRTAMQQYTVAVSRYAVEAERSRVDALVHDRVLTTLVSAARSSSDVERELALGMARSALEILRASTDFLGTPEDIEGVHFSRRLLDAATLLAPDISCSTQDLSDFRFPGTVAEALFSAAIQALVNSVQHAEGGCDIQVQRFLDIRLDAQGALCIEISDTGVGFEADKVAVERLGLRVSIQERVRAVGGSVSINSTLEVGTSLLLRWSANGES